MQLDLDLDAAVHPAAALDGNGANFSPDISETQKVVASPRSAHVHTKKDNDEDGKAGDTVFDRLYKDKEQRERRLTLEKVRIKKEVEKDLTFQPQTMGMVYSAAPGVSSNPLVADPMSKETASYSMQEMASSSTSFRKIFLFSASTSTTERFM